MFVAVFVRCRNSLHAKLQPAMASNANPRAKDLLKSLADRAAPEELYSVTMGPLVDGDGRGAGRV
jgi:hypothetical protein